MLKNYLLLALRHLLKHKMHSALMILGLAIGLAASGMILIINYMEASYDRHWPEASRIYQLESETDMGNGKYPSTGAPDNSYEAIKNHLAGYSHISRKQDKETRIKVGDANSPKTFQEKASLIDNDFFVMFAPQILQGSLDSFYRDEYAAVISEELAIKLFAEEPAIGKVISLDTTNFRHLFVRPGDNTRSIQLKDFTVVAVVKFPAKRTALGPLNLFTHTPPVENAPKDMFGIMTISTYLQFKDGVDVKEIESTLSGIIDSYMPVPEFIKKKPSEMIKLSLLNIQEAHNKFKEQQHQRDNSLTLYGLAITIMLMAGINFTNLALAAQTRRQKEVALRKTMGAQKQDIAQQFLFESLLITAIAFVLSIAIIELCIPWLKNIFSMDIESKALYDVKLLGYLAGAALLLGLISATYPSFYLSRLNPAATLKSNKSIETENSIRFRKLLVIIQFVISGILLNSAIICGIQIQHIQAYQPGFQTHHISYAIHESFSTSKLEDIYKLKNRISSLPNVEAVSFAMPGLMMIQGLEGFKRADRPDDKVIYMGRVNMAASNELQTLNVGLLAGSYFQPEMPQPGATPDQDIQKKIYLNPEALAAFGFTSAQEAINQIIERPATPPDTGSQTYTIVAVTEPIHVGSLNAARKPAIFWPLGNQAMPVSFMIRYRGDNKAIEEDVKKMWQEIQGYTPYMWRIEDAIANEYKDENLIAKFIYLFTGIAIFISCLGLYGLAAHATAKRTKEISLRKIHGASDFNIVKLLVLQFSQPVALANIIIWPISFYVMNRWLEKFVDRIDIVWWGPASLLTASLLSLLIAWATVGGNAYAVARARPADSLRDD